jgi:hypothetical protein
MIDLNIKALVTLSRLWQDGRARQRTYFTDPAGFYARSVTGGVFRDESLCELVQSGWT